MFRRFLGGCFRGYQTLALLFRRAAHVVDKQFLRTGGHATWHGCACLYGSGSHSSTAEECAGDGQIVA